MTKFRIIKSRADSLVRLGAYSTIATPNIIIPTSRGTIPHLTPENVQKHVETPAVFVGLEDFIERVPMKSPIAQFGHSLREYISLLPSSHEIPIFLAPRRSCPIPTSQQNSDKTFSIVTTDGFRQFEVIEYLTLASTLADKDTVILAPVDMPMLISTTKSEGGYSPWKHIGGNRVRKMVVRNEMWSEAALQICAARDVIVPIMPGIKLPDQEEFINKVAVSSAGLTFYDISSPFVPESCAEKLTSPMTGSSADIASLPESISTFARINLAYHNGPHDVLESIAKGYDLFCADWVVTATDAGIAFTFELEQTSDETLPLGISLWENVKYATDLNSLSDDCECHTCKNHHRAYIAHLLSAKEMLAWTLLQIHNLHVASKFMAQIRSAIEQNQFDEASRKFNKTYSAKTQATPGGGPRVRGYQVRLAGLVTDKKLNESPFRSLD
ncbi:tRNA-guanine(15) transglycosylase-like protein [Lipomyces arxii]|uniref:tRNA-guanine(15) transglycosylase-like protein n=1 Tax=Lipomyces arxii TaxID=56418 RepID=UPI0034CEDA05